MAEPGGRPRRTTARVDYQRMQNGEQEQQQEERQQQQQQWSPSNSNAQQPASKRAHTTSGSVQRAAGGGREPEEALLHKPPLLQQQKQEQAQAGSNNAGSSSKVGSSGTAPAPGGTRIAPHLVHLSAPAEPSLVELGQSPVGSLDPTRVQQGPNKVRTSGDVRVARAGPEHRDRQQQRGATARTNARGQGRQDRTRPAGDARWPAGLGAFHGCQHAGGQLLQHAPPHTARRLGWCGGGSRGA